VTLGPSESFSPAVFKQQACVVTDDQVAGSFALNRLAGPRWPV
jgi:hypothetical protein